jgi:uncharacterized SAM-binding protein YcdF (DUF218 family)
MYFIFSKLLLFLILPLNWIFALLIISLMVRNKKSKNRLRIAAVVFLLIFTNSFLLKLFAHAWNYPPGDVSKGTYSCAIVLGGFSSVDEDRHLYFNEASDRFIQGVKLVVTKKASRILITGGNGDLLGRGSAEAPAAGMALTEMGIGKSQIMIEGRSKNTLENAAYSKTVLAQNHVAGPYILVTSAFHMRRSMYIFKKAGLDVIAYPCNYFVGKDKPAIEDLLPDAANLGYWNIYTKEVVGYIFVHFQSIPK